MVDLQFFLVRLLLLVSSMLTLSTAVNSETIGDSELSSKSTRIHMPHSPELQQRLQQSLAAKGATYKPRTEHLQADGKPVYLNRLILEDSPYLIQHAHNPVDWYSWGDEAFAAAKRENKPIFLSIGYSTCHWCHVMEEESFDNPQVATILNQYFISIKVDREQRPDIDSAYMTAVMMITQHGGWPMSSFLTPDGKTFFGGTYFPPERFSELLSQIAQGWQQQPDELKIQAQRIAQAVANVNEAKAKGEAITDALTKQAVQANLDSFDARFGGFSTAPKFPYEPTLLFLLDQNRRHANQSVTVALRKTLDAMAQGGIYDQIGGGFARYATDQHWLIPHFEKMLYNQALLARVYTQSWQQTGNLADQRVARQTLDYVLRDMTTSSHGFYSATDADSEGEEGLFFLWTTEQINTLLKPDDAAFVIKLFGMSKQGNFEGQNILNLPISLTTFAEQNKLAITDVYQHLDKIREIMRLEREKRIHPLRDDKVVTAWNGMMIVALAEAGDALQEPRYTTAAINAAEFLWKAHRKQDNSLWRASLNDNASIPASQEDYAYLAEAFLSLYDVSGETHWLDRAKTLTDSMLEKFWDGKEGGFFMNEPSQAVPILARPKDLNDGAIPSGNSVALRVLAMLTRRTDDLSYENRARNTLGALAGSVKSYPASYGYLLMGRDELEHGTTGSIQYAAKGAVRIVGKTSQDGVVTVSLTMKPGWHINAHKPLDADLIATTITLPKTESGWSLQSVIYPEPVTKTLQFQQQPLALYEDTASLQAQLKPAEQHSYLVQIQINLQACNDQHCLAPETITLQIPSNQKMTL
ncbi:MAG: DUF255 domain-containing protein [Methylococcales bacterium]